MQISPPYLRKLGPTQALPGVAAVSRHHTTVFYLTSVYRHTLFPVCLSQEPNIHLWHRHPQVRSPATDHQSARLGWSFYHFPASYPLHSLTTTNKKFLCLACSQSVYQSRPSPSGHRQSILSQPTSTVLTLAQFSVTQAAVSRDIFVSQEPAFEFFHLTRPQISSGRAVLQPSKLSKQSCARSFRIESHFPNLAQAVSPLPPVVKLLSVSYET